VAKLIYESFGNRDQMRNVGPNGIMMYIDNNKNNLRFENLNYVTRSEFNKTRIEKKRKKCKPQRYRTLKKTTIIKD
jgi:hypothetical protein